VVICKELEKLRLKGGCVDAKSLRRRRSAKSEEVRLKVYS
jgi:hypothetical protein